MNSSDTISKANILTPAEDYNKLHREGIQHIEKLAGEVWTDYNTHDPGITLLEALCYAVTDLAYRTGFKMEDLLAQTTFDSNAWKNIFYTAREILPCNPITISDYRKLIVDVDGVRNAWITISKDYEVPIYLEKPDMIVFDTIKNQQVGIQSLCCDSYIKLPFRPKMLDAKEYGLNFTNGDIIELNGLYKIIIEFEEEIIEKGKEDDVRKKVLRMLHSHRNVCEDFLSVTGAEYRDFSLYSKVLIAENADADMILAEMCYRIQNYFTPAVRFYTLDEMQAKGFPVDEIFEGPALTHGFIPDKELAETDMFRDMRLSDIINSISDIDGIHSLKVFKITDELNPDFSKGTDGCSNEKYFDEWIVKMINENLVGRLSVEEIVRLLNSPVSDPSKAVLFYKPSGQVTIDTERFQKLLHDLKGRDKYLKLDGFKNDFPVPLGENMDLNNFYPVQYELPFNYRVGESGLPLRDGKTRLIQSLQLKGYLAVFEQLFLNYLFQLSNLNEFFSFNDVKFKGKTEHKPVTSECDHLIEEPEVKKEPAVTYPNQIISRDTQNEIKEKIAGYSCLYYDADRYINELQNLIEPEDQFEWHRNRILDHLLARFNENMDEYVSLMKCMYPDDYLLRVIKNKTDFLSDYPAVSNNRSQAYNYRLYLEKMDYENQTWDEERIAMNISGLEKRIARLIGLSDYKRKDLSPYNLFVEEIEVEQGTGDDKKIKIVLYENQNKERILLETEAMEVKCIDEVMHCFIGSGCNSKNFKKHPEDRSPQPRVHRHIQREEFSFYLTSNEGKVLASSPVYYKGQVRDEVLQLAKCYLERICSTEGLHMVEHILLRPKGDYQFTENKNTKYGEEFKLLNICLDKCDLKEPDKGDVPNYKFDIEVLPPEECLDGKRWNVILSRIKPTVKQILSHHFKEYELASAFISKVRQYGSEIDNYYVYVTDLENNPDYYFILKDTRGISIAESVCYSKKSANYDKILLGTDKKCDETADDPKEIDEEIKQLKEFLAYELDLYKCEEACNHNEDPYSFRLTFVLPCWSKRFRNHSFRKFVEKTIHSETPAHIKSSVFWLGIEKMRKFEEAYFNWVIEMAGNDVPRIEICNDLIEEINNLENCDVDCKKEKALLEKSKTIPIVTEDKSVGIKTAEIRKDSVSEKKDTAIKDQNIRQNKSATRKNN